jgi:polyferredoxin
LNIIKLRIFALISVHVLILAHVLFFGSDTIGSIDFQEFFHAFVKHGIINAGGILVLLAFLTTLIFGRFFCGWACHFGAIQELCWWLLNKLDIKPKTIDSKLVTVLPIIILLNFYVIPNLFYAFNHPWRFSIAIDSPEIWAFLPGWIIGTLTFFIDGFLIVYFLGRKGFCRFLCPWGAFLKLPNALAMFKVRKTGNCSHCHECTTHCPVGIDVSYEINTYQKVTNTNCTSCLMCTSGCPENALSYQFGNPAKEDVKLSHFIKQKQFSHIHIREIFTSIRSKDFLLLILTLLAGFAIDGLYGMGHFMAFGIAIITGYFVISKNNYKHVWVKPFLNIFVLFMFLWHGTIKFSIWQGFAQYEANNYVSSISHLERAVSLYPKSIGRFHLLLGEMYFEQGDRISSFYHAKIAKEINPDHQAPMQLINEIKRLK